MFFFFHFTDARRPSRAFWRGFSPSPARTMAASSSGGGALKDLVHPNLNETLKTHNSVSFKLVKTGEFMNVFSTLKFYNHLNGVRSMSLVEHRSMSFSNRKKWDIVHKFLCDSTSCNWRSYCCRKQQLSQNVNMWPWVVNSNFNKLSARKQRVMFVKIFSYIHWNEICEMREKGKMFHAMTRCDLESCQGGDYEMMSILLILAICQDLRQWNFFNFCRGSIIS